MKNNLKKKISQFSAHREMKRREAEKRAREQARKLQDAMDREAKAKGIDALKLPTQVMPEPKKVTRTQNGGSAYTKKVWTFEIEDLETGARIVVDSSKRRVREAHAQQARRRDQTLRDLFITTRTDLVEIPPDGNYVLPLIRFFQGRARKVRSGR